MSRRMEGGESKAIAYAPSTNHPMEIKSATMPRYSDIPVATPRNVRGTFNRYKLFISLLLVNHIDFKLIIKLTDITYVNTLYPELIL